MNKDTRETLPAKGSFYEQVVTLFQNKQKAAMLYDHNGVTRGNGLITPILAINGLFASDYSEC